MKIKDIVFTDHAIQRMQERKIPGEWAYKTIKEATKINPGKEKHTTEFVKHFEEKLLTVIGKKNDIGEWVILSAWIDPPLPGTKDFNKRNSYLKKLKKFRFLDRKMEKASFWGKLWITFRKQMGI